MNISKIAIATLCGVSLALSASARQQIVFNGSFEQGDVPGGPDFFKSADWTEFGPGATERSIAVNLVPVDGEAAYKAFGGADDESGVFQDVAVSPGDSVEASAQVFTLGTDKLGGSAAAGIRLSFLDAGMNPVGSATSDFVLTSSSTADVWTPASVGPVSAPPNAAFARLEMLWNGGASPSGSAYWDDAMLFVNAVDELLNGDFEAPGVSETFSTDGWLGFGARDRTDQLALFGDFSATIEVGFDSGSTFSGWFQDTGVTAEALERIVARAKIFNPAATGLTADARSGIKLEFRQAGGGTLPPAEENLGFDPNQMTTDTWIEVSYSTVVPDDITLARIIFLSFDDFDTNGPVYADSASAIRGSQPGVNQLTNASFEQGSSSANGLTGWTEFFGLFCRAAKFDTFFDPDITALDGDNVVEFSGSCTAGIYQDVEVTPGETLTVSAFFFQKDGDPYFTTDPNEPVGAGPKIEWRAGSLPNPNQIDIIVGQPNTLTAPEPFDVWLPVEIDYTMPPGTAAALRVTAINGRYGSEGLLTNFDGFEAVITNRFDGADVDADFDQDLADAAQLQQCFDPGMGLGFPCLVYDFDENETIAGSDWAFFEPRMTGPAE